ncbi:MAG: C39 family peptidase [Bacteroidales bacterium]|nr:C39 family peptidase [Bacteroidales bacterium]
MALLRNKKHIVLVLLLLFPGWIFAQKIYYVGIPGSKINYVSATQEKTQWCWAASIQMVLNYYNIAITQKQIVERTYGRNIFGELPDWAANIETVHLNLNNWSIDNQGKKYIVSSQFGLGAPEPFFLIEELSQHRPVIIGYNANFGGHAVVITALSYYETQMGPVIRSIIVRDPLPGLSCGAESNGRVEYEASTLAKRITAYWFIRVFNAGF